MKFILVAVAAGTAGFLLSKRLNRAGFHVDRMRVEHLEVGEAARIPGRASGHTLDESGGILRFDIGPSDVFENGLE